MNHDRTIDRYLSLLSLKHQPPSLEYLSQIVKAQLRRVPFENISKLYYLQTEALNSLIQFEQHLDGIERYHVGGTCYANNYYLNRLLVELGFSVKLCGAHMSEPDVHIVNIVRLYERDYLVDVGYGAPFDSPLPLDTENGLRISLGNEEYRLKTINSSGFYVMQHYRDGQLIHGYRVNPVARSIDYFEHVIKSSFSPNSEFMKNVRVIKFSPDRTLSLLNLSLKTTTKQGIKRETVTDLEQLLRILEKRFGIPATISRPAIEKIAVLHPNK